MTAEPGASHAKRGRPSPATVDLLGRAHAALRDELADLIAELRPAPPDGPPVFGQPVAARPSLADRSRIVDLIGKCMALLGSEVVATDTPDAAAPARRRAPRRVDYG